MGNLLAVVSGGTLGVTFEKRVKIKQKPLTNQSKRDTNTGTRRMCHAGFIDRAYVLGMITAPTLGMITAPTPTVLHARASIIYEAAAL